MIERFEPFLKSLPVIPEVGTRILTLTGADAGVSFKELERLIMLDPGLTAKILKIANSALYSRQREIKSLQTALTLLGFKNIRRLVLLVTTAQTFARFAATRFHQVFWRHSLLSAFFARSIALCASRPEAAEECFLGALLHDIGQVALHNAGADRYRPVLDLLEAGLEPVEERETALYGVNHREVGAAILTRWNFPDLYTDLAREHQSLNVSSPHKELIVLVGIADILAESARVAALGARKAELLAGLLPHSPLQESDLQYYRTRFLADLGQDPQVRESHSLFGILS